MKKKCDSCGVDYLEDEGWVECPDCGKFYCLHCTDKMREESRKIEKLRDGDAFTRVQILCPSCSIEMLR